jgi:hypothetical protein
MCAADIQHRMSQEKNMWWDHNKYLNAECALQKYDKECHNRSTCEQIIPDTLLSTGWLIVKIKCVISIKIPV